MHINAYEKLNELKRELNSKRKILKSVLLIIKVRNHFFNVHCVHRPIAKNLYYIGIFEHELEER